MTSQDFPKISWNTGIHHEALRLIYYLKRLPEQELQSRGFLILPHSVEKYKKQTIVFPDLNYSSLPQIWSKSAKLAATTPMTAPIDLINQVQELLKKSYQIPQKPLLRFQKIWHEVGNEFLKSLLHLLPQYQNTIKEINFIVTFNGTVSQFNLVTPKINSLTIYLRADADRSDIFQAIILSLIRHELQHHQNRTWDEIESISDFLLYDTILQKFLSKNSSSRMMTKIKTIQSTILHRQSQKYLASLGLPSQNHWRSVKHSIFYKDIKIDHLTHRQSQLLQLLISNYGEVVSNEVIADLLWPSGENYSLWAIVKEIARVRRCLVNSNLSRSLLKSHRKLGYSLH